MWYYIHHDLQNIFNLSSRSACEKLKLFWEEKLMIYPKLPEYLVDLNSELWHMCFIYSVRKFSLHPSIDDFILFLVYTADLVPHKHHGNGAAPTSAAWTHMPTQSVLHCQSLTVLLTIYCKFMDNTSHYHTKCIKKPTASSDLHISCTYIWWIFNNLLDVQHTEIFLVISRH